MTYRNLYEVCAALSDLSIDEVKGPKGDAIGKLLKVYFDAEQNPPFGVIGVGCITYAEDALIAYQIENGAN